MFIYGHSNPKVQLITERLVVRLVNERDAYRLADYYTQNREFLRPWEPVRDQSHCYPYGWQSRLNLIHELQKQGNGYYFVLLGHDEDEVRGVANFSNVLRGAFYACYLGYSLGEKWQGQGMMYEGLNACIPYIFRQQKMHRIMANYMPHNHRSGNLLKRLGFTQEGYAKKYLLINGKWQDHILMSLLNAQWIAPR